MRGSWFGQSLDARRCGNDIRRRAVSSGMESLTLAVTHEEHEALARRAKDLGLSEEELLRRGLHRVLEPKGLSFRDALEYTFRKNAALYRRLA